MGRTATTPRSSLVLDAAADVDTCATSSDCVLVQAGDVCNPCPAGSFHPSINVSQQTAYDQAFDALKVECPPSHPVGCPAIATFAAACAAGKCAVGTMPGCVDGGS